MFNTIRFHISQWAKEFLLLPDWASIIIVWIVGVIVGSGVISIFFGLSGISHFIISYFIAILLSIFYTACFIGIGVFVTISILEIIERYINKSNSKP